MWLQVDEWLSLFQVLIIGGGDGGVLREAVKHPLVESVVQCEIDEVIHPASFKDCSNTGHLICHQVLCGIVTSIVWSSVPYWPVLLVGCNHCVQEVPPWNGKGLLQSQTHPACGGWLWVYETEPRRLWCHHYWFIWPRWWEKFLSNGISTQKKCLMFSEQVHSSPSFCLSLSLTKQPQITSYSLTTYRTGLAYCFKLPHLTTQSCFLKEDIGYAQFARQFSVTYSFVWNLVFNDTGPAESLFKESYYQLMKTALRDGGILCCQGDLFSTHGQLYMLYA